MNTDLQQSSQAIRLAIKDATRGLIERETLADLIVLAAVASEHILVIGPPGTAKSAVVRRVAQSIGGQYYEYLLGRFTEPGDIFGPIDIRKLRDGVIETEVSGMLPEAEVAFLDEVFLGSTAILNTLLSLLNERVYRRGHTRIDCPLRVCVGASNALPDEESLSAFADRFLIHHFVQPVPDSLLEKLLDGGWQANAQESLSVDRLHELDELTQAAKKADFTALRPALSHCIRLLRKAGVQLSDRRIVKSQMLIAAAAVLAGRENPTDADLWPLIYVIATEEGQQTGREILRDVLEAAENSALNAAAEDATMSPASIAVRICDQAEVLFNDNADQDNGSWKLQLEAIGREIDAVFPTETIPGNLQVVRQKIVGLIEAANGVATETGIETEQGNV